MEKQIAELQKRIDMLAHKDRWTADDYRLNHQLRAELAKMQKEAA